MPREAENWNSREVFGRHRYATTEKWRDSAGRPLMPETHYVVGGNILLAPKLGAVLGAML